MLTSTTTEDRRIDLTDRLDPPNDFNFAHFRMRHMIAELIRTHHRLGIEPGREAPDFELPTTDGSTISPSSLRGQPVLLHFVSYTCPVTRGNAELMRNLHRRFGHRIHFLDVLVRQAHPGERHGRYLSFAEKLSDAGRYQDEESTVGPDPAARRDDRTAARPRRHGVRSRSRGRRGPAPGRRVRLRARRPATRRAPFVGRSGVRHSGSDGVDGSGAIDQAVGPTVAGAADGLRRSRPGSPPAGRRGDRGRARGGLHSLDRTDAEGEPALIWST
ncbi:MAG: redoxin domain-containing protein [Actinobacteria bacterium]|nr:redoxin domain-containing protein [Actinomycetota bacterium]